MNYQGWMTRRSFLGRAAATGAGFAAAARWAGADDKTLNERLVTDFGAKPDDDGLQTAAIQAAIDAAAKRGGGTVRIPKGRFICGAIRLRDNIRLVLDGGAVLQGSTDWRDYGKGGWTDALITASDARDIRIEGPGLIDGSDCFNPKGEEQFRGPHAIYMTGCRNITIADLAMSRTGNYAMLCRDCSGAEVRGVSVRGGHDGLHAQACNKFKVSDCDFRTPDDCLAGCDNTDFEVVDCRLNSSCNGFRFGCVNLLVKNCRFRGPGEYPLLGNKGVRRFKDRTSMLSAFIHFAPKDRNPRLPSDNWLIRDCTMEDVDRVYSYDIERGVWGTGQPALKLRFVNVKASGLAHPIRVLGDTRRQFELTIEDATFSFRDGRQDQPHLDLTRFGSLVLRNVTLHNSVKAAALVARDGNAVRHARVRCVPERAAPFSLERIEAVSNDDGG